MVETMEQTGNHVDNSCPNKSDKAGSESSNSALQERDINLTSRAPVNGDQPAHEADEANYENPDILAPWELDDHDDEDPHEIDRGKEQISAAAADSAAHNRGENSNGNRPKRVTINEFLHAEKEAELSESRDDYQLDQQDTSMVSAISTPVETDVGLVKKKRKKSKPKSKRGLTAPTGFEEFYVDAPVTPAEHEVEKEIYDLRIEVAIQRYISKRNMDSARKDVFDKYMLYGGISAGVKQYSGGLDAQDLSNRSATDIALMKSTHFVNIEEVDSENSPYVVDFGGCAKAFLSSRLLQVWNMSSDNCEKEVRSKTNIIRNFLNYLLHHDVCPEYKDQINAARLFCDQTDGELPKCIRARAHFPGDFQTACSEIFGGLFRGTYAVKPSWAEDMESYAGISPDTARQTFKIGLAAQGTDAVSRAYKRQSNDLSIQTAKSKATGLEVTEVIPANREIKHFYDTHPAAKGLKALGKLRAKTWEPPYRFTRDLTKEERLAEAKAEKVAEHFEFLIEDYILESCFVGMKLEAIVREMSFGLQFFDRLDGVYCSFYDVLPYEVMDGWKDREPENLPMRQREIMSQSLEEATGTGEGEGKGGDGKESQETIW